MDTATASIAEADHLYSPLAVANDVGPVRPHSLHVQAADESGFVVDVTWRGRECVLRAVVVRRLLTEAGVRAQPVHTRDGQLWELHLGPVAGDRVGKLIEAFVW
ncbi:MAG: hypothetical protein ACRDL4_06450 [Thermoleophilaceae bacterium]